MKHFADMKVSYLIMCPMVQTRTEYVCMYVSKFGVQWVGEKVVAESLLALHIYIYALFWNVPDSNGGSYLI